jgi:hypothetical protein
MDDNIPHMPGDVFARALRGIRHDVTIILCTGDSSMTHDKSRALGFDGLPQQTL